MNITDVKVLIKTMIQKKCPVTPMLWGRHGLGKSSAIRQVGDELGYRLLDIRLAQKEAIDITGMLFTFEDKKLGMSVTSAHPPQWFADALKNGKVILFLDEFNMARREVTNATFELVLDRKLNNVPLPDDVFIVCAGNPEDERYDGVTPMSESLIDRLMHIKVTPDVDGWLKWAEKEEINPSLVSFIRATPEALYHNNKLDEKFPVTIKHSERSIARCSEVLKLQLDTELQYECFCGILGAEVATLFVKTIEKENMPVTVKEVYAMKPETKERLKRYRENMRQDLISITVANFIDHANKNPVEATKHLDNVVEFINTLAEESATVVISGTRTIPEWASRFLKDKNIKAKLDTIHEVVKDVKATKKNS